MGGADRVARAFSRESLLAVLSGIHSGIDALLVLVGHTVRIDRATGLADVFCLLGADSHSNLLVLSPMIVIDAFKDVFGQPEQKARLTIYLRARASHMRVHMRANAK